MLIARLYLIGLITLCTILSIVHSKHTHQSPANDVVQPIQQQRQPGFGGTHGYGQTQGGIPDYSQIGMQYKNQYAPDNNINGGDSGSTNDDMQQQYADQYKGTGEQYKQQGKQIGEQYKQAYKNNDINTQDDDIAEQQKANGKAIGEQYKNAYKHNDDSSERFSASSSSLIDSTTLYNDDDSEQYEHTLRKLVKQHDRSNQRIAELRDDIHRLRESIESQEQQLDEQSNDVIHGATDSTGRQSFNSGDEWSKFYKQYTKPYAKYWQSAQPQGTDTQSYGGGYSSDTTQHNGYRGPHHQPGVTHGHDDQHHHPHKHHPHHTTDKQHHDKHASHTLIDASNYDDINIIDSSKTDQNDAAIRQSAHDAIIQRHHHIPYQRNQLQHNIALIDFDALSGCEVTDIDSTRLYVTHQILSNEKQLLQSIESNLIEQQQLNERQRELEQDEIERLQDELQRRYERAIDKKERQLERAEDAAEREYEKYKDKRSDVKDYKKDIKDRSKDLKDKAKQLHELKKHLHEQRKQLYRWEHLLSHEQNQLDDKLDTARKQVKHAEQDADKQHSKYKHMSDKYDSEHSAVKQLEHDNNELYKQYKSIKSDYSELQDEYSDIKHDKSKLANKYDELQSQSHDQHQSHDRHEHHRDKSHDDRDKKHEHTDEHHKHNSKSTDKHTLVELSDKIDNMSIGSLSLIEATFQQLTDDTLQLVVESDDILSQYTSSSLSLLQWFTLITVLLIGSVAFMYVAKQFNILRKQTTYQPIHDYPQATQQYV